LWCREKVGQETSRLSDAMHHGIAAFYNNDPLFETITAVEVTTHLISFHDEIIFKQKLRPFRSYWHIFDADTRLASTVDMLFHTGRDLDKLYMFSFRRVKELKVSSSSNNMFAPIDHLPDNNYTQYALELNLNTYILERRYHKQIQKMFIVVLHPELNSFGVKEVPRMNKEVLTIITDRSIRVPIAPNNLTPSTVEESPRGQEKKRGSYFFGFA
jgi:hypothetical protein